jgi:protein-disulfide isomerase
MPPTTDAPYFRTSRLARRGSVLFAWLKRLFFAAQVIMTKWAGAEAEEWNGMDRMIRAVLALVTALTLVSTVARAADTSTTRDARQPEYQTLFAQLEKTDVVQEGAKEAQSILYVFFDANCFYCHLTWKALQPYETAGLQVRWVPVAYQQPSSVGRAAAIMQAPDRATALRINEVGYNANQFDGGIEPMAKVSHTVAAQLQANTRLMGKFGAPGTPALVWRDGNGKVRLKVGVPRLSELPQITRLTAQPNDDPELANFR